MNAKLKPVRNEEVTETRLGYLSHEDIIGRSFKKPKLTPPYFPPVEQKPVSHGDLKTWLQNLKKKRVKKLDK